MVPVIEEKKEEAVPVEVKEKRRMWNIPGIAVRS